MELRIANLYLPICIHLRDILILDNFYTIFCPHDIGVSDILSVIRCRVHIVGWQDVDVYSLKLLEIYRIIWLSSRDDNMLVVTPTRWRKIKVEAQFNVR